MPIARLRHHGQPATPAPRRRSDPARAVGIVARRTQGPARRHDYAHRCRSFPRPCLRESFLHDFGRCAILDDDRSGSRSRGGIPAGPARKAPATPRHPGNTLHARRFGRARRASLAADRRGSHRKESGLSFRGIYARGSQRGVAHRQAGRAELECSVAKSEAPARRGACRPYGHARSSRGRPLYAYARRGEHVPRAARRVAIRRLELEGFEGNTVGLFVECSKGTYIRALAEDIGADLGCGAHLAALQRTSVGPFALREAMTLEALESISPVERRERLLPLEALLQSWPRLTLEAPLAAKFRQGRTMSVESASGSVAVFGEDAKFLGTGQVDAGGTLQPKRLLALS